jgi:hypothetical protein
MSMDQPELTPPSDDLTDAALTPADRELMKLLDVEDKPRPRRGRPPSVTKPANSAIKRPAGQTVSARSRVIPPKTGSTTPPKIPRPREDSRTPDEILKEKKEKAEEYSKYITEEINDKLLLGLISMGVPSHLLYQPGKAPDFQQATDDKYTPLGAAITVSPLHADIWGRFAAEAMTSTDAGKSAATALGNSKAMLWLYGVLSVGCGISYARTLNETYKKLQPLIEAYQRAQQQGNQPQQQNSPQNNGAVGLGYTSQEV